MLMLCWIHAYIIHLSISSSLLHNVLNIDINSDRILYKHIFYGLFLIIPLNICGCTKTIVILSIIKHYKIPYVVSLTRFYINMIHNNINSYMVLYSVLYGNLN